MVTRSLRALCLLLLFAGCRSLPGSGSPGCGERRPACESSASDHGPPSGDYGECKGGGGPACATPARPTCLPAAIPPPPAPQRVIIEVVQRTAAPPAAPPAAVPVALPAPAPALPPAMMQAVPAAPSAYARVGLTLGWFHLPLPFPRLQPVLVQPEPSIVSVPVQVQPGAVAMMPVPQLVPVQAPPACAPPLTALPPAAGCPFGPSAAAPPAPPVRADAAAELMRGVDALREAMERAAAGAKK